MATEYPVVLVTGCSAGGIGFHLCEEFAARGCRVYATARNLDKLQGFSHSSITTLSLDVTKDENVNSVVKHIIDVEGRIDVVVNNAGGLCVGPLIDIPIDKVQEAFDVNTFATLRMARAVLPHMASRKQGTLVTLGSIAGEIPTPWNGIYCAAKAAVHTITEVLYMECKPFGVNVMLVSPGSVRSNIANNAASWYEKPVGSLYGAFSKHILNRLNVSQRPNTSMPTDEFARAVVREVLKEHPPRYMTLGGLATQVRLALWLPRGFVLDQMWKRFS